jgi:hypothetical protein
MPEDSSRRSERQPQDECASLPDWYFESGLLVYTAAYHLKRGHCCGSGCRHCPYDPRHVEGSTTVSKSGSRGGS